MSIQFKIDLLERKILNFTDSCTYKLGHFSSSNPDRSSETWFLDSERGRLNLKVEKYARKIVDHLGSEGGKDFLQRLQGLRSMLTRAMTDDEKDLGRVTRARQGSFSPLPLVHASFGCPVLERTQPVPLIDSYERASSHPFFEFRLDQSAINAFPSPFLNAIGPLSGKEVDLMFYISDASSFQILKSGDHVNMCVHSWVYRHVSEFCDVRTPVDIGLFQPFGFYPYNGFEGIGFNALSSQEVHIHPKGEIMVASPDNVRFWRDPDCPFGTCWVAAKTQERVLITKMIVFFEKEKQNGICDSLYSFLRETNHYNLKQMIAL